MSSKSDQLVRAIREIARDPNAEVYAVLAEVIAVDEGERTCTIEPLNGDAQVTGIRFANSANAMFLAVPAIGSIVLVDFFEDSEGYISMFSEVDSLVFSTTPGNVIQLQDGSFGGIVKVTDLVSKLNAIEQDINNLKSAISDWTPVPNDGGAALKAALASYAGSTLTQTTRQDLENESITHGEA